MKKDYYLILQVDREASPEEIRSAYRQRALELHPDLSGTDYEPFLELQEAYEVLGDPARRALYDRGTEEIPVWLEAGAVRRRRSAEPFRQSEPTRGFRDFSLLRSFSEFHPSFEDLFNRLESNFGVQSHPKGERLESLTVDVPLSPEEAFAGGSVRILVPARVPCPRCHGRGDVGGYHCWRCQGQGAVLVEYPLVLNYPPMHQDSVMRVPLDDLGIHNFYLTVRFRPTVAA